MWKNRWSAVSAALLAAALVYACDGANPPPGEDAGGGREDAGATTDGGATEDAGAAEDAGGGEDAGPPPGSPTCTITGPLDGTAGPWDEEITLIATASDPEDGPLSGASVVWRSSLVTEPLGSDLSLTRALPVPGDHVITCIATDSEGNTGTDTITVIAQSPVAEIWHPGDGETRTAGSDIPFTGRGRDFEDGMLDGASLVWTSSIDGMFGTGTDFSAPLSAGTNVVTLTVTDADGNIGQASITLTIVP